MAATLDISGPISPEVRRDVFFDDLSMARRQMAWNGVAALAAVIVLAGWVLVCLLPAFRIGTAARDLWTQAGFALLAIKSALLLSAVRARREWRRAIDEVNGDAAIHVDGRFTSEETRGARLSRLVRAVTAAALVVETVFAIQATQLAYWHWRH